jgi:putative ABC transport system permease protein
MSVRLGDEVEVGLARLTVTRVLIAEPDRGGSFLALGPRLMMNLADVPETGVVQPGSRIGYRLLLRGEDGPLETLRTDLGFDASSGFRWVDVREASPRIGSALDRAESFLLLGGLLAVLLAGVAVALSAHRYARRHYDHVGIFKTLGATPDQVLWGYVMVLVLVGAAAVALGTLIGGVLHLAIVAILGNLIPVALPMPSVRPFLLGATTGFICALAFALPPLIHLRNVSPMRVIRRDLGAAPVSQWLSYGAAAAGSLLLLVWYSRSLMLTLWTLGGALVVLAIFGVLATVLLRGGRALGMQAGSGWRLALSGLQRRRRENTAQILIFGLAIMLLLVLILLRTALIDEWRSALPDDVPNHFVMNITPDQVEPVGAMLDRATRRQGPLYPMFNGRIVDVNGVDAKAWDDARRQRDSEGPRVNSERNLTWSHDLPVDNEVVAGEWWGPDEAGALVSLEEEYARDLGLNLGDRLTFDIAGTRVAAEIASLRVLDWESMQPNFFIVFSPAALTGVAATYMTSFNLERDQKIFLNELLSAYPTLTVIEIDAIIMQVQIIVDQVTQAVELVLALVVFSGCLVLVASIQAGRDARVREHALVRTLGGTKRLITGSLAIEFAALGVFAGVVAVVGAEVTVALLQNQVFDLPVQVHPWLWLAGPLFGGVLILVVGLWGTRRLVSSPPMLVLRDSEA